MVTAITLMMAVPHFLLKLASNLKRFRNTSKVEQEKSKVA
jgi:hypothetical protein|nr:MAG TPA: hypothetical protein [Caudoviricetes sp.]